MENDRNYHFALGHFCAGCNISNYLHTGCIVDGNVRIVKTETKKPPIKVFGVVEESRTPGLVLHRDAL